MVKGISIFASLFVSFSALVSCARTATSPDINKVIQFSFKVKGKLPINRNDITYYIIFNAPVTTADKPFDSNQGPRVNGPDINKSTQFLESRIPFIFKFPGDIDSFWTDFFFIRSVNGKMTIGRGKKDSNGNPVIYDRNYANQNTGLIDRNGNIVDPSKVDVSTIAGYKTEFFISDLNDGKFNGNSVTVNLASSDSIDNGIGVIYDSWKNNTPFTISLTSLNSPQNQIDSNTSLVLRKILDRPLPVVPSGVNDDELNIIECTAIVTQ